MCRCTCSLPLQIQQHNWHCSACGTERDVAAVEEQLCGMLQQVRAAAVLRWVLLCGPCGAGDALAVWVTFWRCCCCRCGLRQGGLRRL